MRSPIRRTAGGIVYLVALAVFACASPPVPSARVAVDGAPGTYHIVLYAHDRAPGTAPTTGVIVLSASVLPRRIVRALDARAGWGEGGNGIDPRRANGCIKWRGVGSAEGPSPSTIGWARDTTDSIFVSLYYVVDYGQALRLHPQSRDTVRGIREHLVVRFAGDPAPPTDSVLLIRVAPPDPTRCLERGAV